MFELAWKLSRDGNDLLWLVDTQKENNKNDLEGTKHMFLTGGLLLEQPSNSCWVKSNQRLQLWTAENYRVI